MKTKNKKKTLKSNFFLKEDWNQYCQQQQKLLCEQQNASLIEKARVEHNIETESNTDFFSRCDFTLLLIRAAGSGEGFKGQANLVLWGL